MEAFIFADSHVRSRKEALSLRGFLNSFDSELKVCLGDLFDYPEIARKYFDLFNDIKWVRGNHEYGLELPSKLEVREDGFRILFTHGHELFPVRLFESKFVQLTPLASKLGIPELLFRLRKKLEYTYPAFLAKKVWERLNFVDFYRLSKKFDAILLGHFHIFDKIEINGTKVVIIPPYPSYAILKGKVLKVYSGERVFKVRLKA